MEVVTADLALKRGTDGTALAQAFIAHDSPFLTVPRPENGIISLYVEGAPLACLVTCRWLLDSRTAREVVIFSDLTTPALSIKRAAPDATCPHGMQTGPDLTYCFGDATPALTTLSYALNRVAPPQDTDALRDLWELTVRSGAASQRVHIVEAVVPTGGGILVPTAQGTWGEHLSCRSTERIRSFATFEVDHLPTRSTQAATPAEPAALFAAVMQTLRDR